MRINLDIDDDVLLAVEEIAQRRECSTGKALSELARQVLVGQNELRLCNGIPLFQRSADVNVVTLEIVNQLRDETP